MSIGRSATATPPHQHSSRGADFLKLVKWNHFHNFSQLLPQNLSFDSTTYWDWGMRWEGTRQTPHKFRYNFNLGTNPDYGNRGVEFFLKISMNVWLFAVLVVRCESVTIEFVLKPVINGEKQSSPRAELSGPVNIFSTAVRQSLIGMSWEETFSIIKTLSP